MLRKRLCIQLTEIDIKNSEYKLLFLNFEVAIKWQMNRSAKKLRTVSLYAELYA
jgi:hypothetical protein